jgi:hypothetical protein
VNHIGYSFLSQDQKGRYTMSDSRKGFTQIRQHSTSADSGEAVKGTILSSDLELANQYMTTRAVVPVAHIKWSDRKLANDKIQYSHVIGETPFGRFKITWKSWKEDPCPTVDETPWGGFLNAYSDVEEAKLACKAEYQIRIEQALKQEPTQ